MRSFNMTDLRWLGYLVRWPVISWIWWEESELCLVDSNKQVDHYERSLNCLQLASASKVSIYWCLQCCLALGLQLIVTLLARLYYFQFSMMDLSRVWTGTLGSILTRSTIWAISHYSPNYLNLSVYISILFLSPVCCYLMCCIRKKSIDLWMPIDFVTKICSIQQLRPNVK